MLVTFALGLLAIILAPALSLSRQKTLRDQLFFFLPVGALINLALLIVSAMITQKFLAVGSLRLAVIVAGSGILTHFALRELARLYRPTLRKFHTNRNLYLIALVALVTIADSAYILGKQGWPFQDWTVLTQPQPFFSTPFQTESHKNVILINSLVRNDDSAFLYRSEMKYPLAWHQLGAAIVAPFPANTTLPLVMGWQLASAYLIFFFLIWIVAFRYPKAAFRYPQNVLLGLLLCFHADIFSFIYSLVVNGTGGIESDGSFPPFFFRNFSLKLLATTAPAQALAMVFSLCYLLAPRIFRRAPQPLLTTVRIVAISLALLLSPPLALITFPLVIAFDIYQAVLNKKDWMTCAVRGVTGIIAAATLFYILDGNSPWELAAAPLIGDIGFPLLKLESEQWLGLPALWVASSGIIGVLLTYFFVRALSRKDQRQLWSNAPLMVLLIGGLLLHYLVTGMEIRRHFAMLATILCPLAIASLYPRKSQLTPSIIKIPLQLMVFVGLSLHFFFLYAHTGRPSNLEADMPWSDYYAMNQLIQQKLPKIPVLGAIPRGFSFPPVMEVTSSFATPASAALTSRTSPSQIQSLVRIHAPADVVAYGISMGYRALLWGPVEQRHWGTRVQERFINQAKVIATVGTVSLLELSDSLKAQFAGKYEPDSVEYHFRLGEALAKKSWNQEAVDNFYAVLQKQPNHAKAHNSLGLILANQGSVKDAVTHFSRAIQAEPKFRDAYNNLGALMILTNNTDKAIETLMKGLELGADAELLVNIAQAHAQANHNDEAIKYYHKALALKPLAVAKLQGLIGLGDTYIRMGDFRKGIVTFEKALKEFPNQPSVHVKLGNAYAYLGNTGEASKNYNLALRLNPNFEPARRALAMIASSSTVPSTN